MITHDLSFLDKPEIIQYIFYPRKQSKRIQESDNTYTILFELFPEIKISSRFYCAPNSKFAPIVLLFHGNGEIAADYDFIGPMYQKLGINLLVVDYRGYGLSSGTPSFSSMITDALTVYQKVRNYLIEKEYIGSVSIMGRSLGSASAIEIAFQYQSQLHSLIIESGFAYTYALLKRLGVPSDFLPNKYEARVSPLAQIEAIKIPALVIHGEKDNIIPLKDGKALFQALSSVDKKLLLIPNAGHNDLLLVGPREYMNAIKSRVKDTE